MIELIIPGTQKIFPGAACCADLMCALDDMKNMCS
jgi:hypothetical protein